MSKLQILLQQGENNAVEFKSAGVSPDGLAKEIVAFANTLGGSILMGVEDDGTISGEALSPSRGSPGRHEFLRLFSVHDRSKRPLEMG